jgi:hypothetical protein
MERSLGVSVLRLVTGKVPDDQGLVAAAGEKHVGAAAWLVEAIFARLVDILLHRSGQASDPAIL